MGSTSGHAAIVYHLIMPVANHCEAAFDHAYTVVRDLLPYLELKSRGFTVPQEQREHPGSVTCTYLPFSCPANVSLGRPYQYLEFVQIGDLRVYAETTNVPRSQAGLKERSEARLLAPGFSLVTNDVPRRLGRLQPQFAENRPAIDHVNYRWQTESEPHGPGWTYLKFREDVLPFCNFWFTEYEPDPLNPNRARPVIEPNPNTCHEILGCVWDLGWPERTLVEKLQRLTGGELQGEQLLLNGQFTIFFGHPSVSALATLASRGPFRAMVLGCTSLATFKRLASPDQIVQWNGQEAAILTPYPSGWAIVVIQSGL